MNFLHVRTSSLIATMILALHGCTPNAGTSPKVASRRVIVEGIILSVEYELDEGRTGGLTRRNSADAVPGGNGSWNVDAYGQLTDAYLIITYPESERGPRVIPAHRLIDIHFGDGGIKHVTQGAAAKDH